MNTKLTSKQRRDLEIEISFMKGLVARDPRFIEAWQILGDDFSLRGQVDQCLKVDQKLARLCPRDPVAQYNLACSYSLNGKFEQAIGALEHALSLGYDDYDWLANDPDLADLRDYPHYVVIDARIRHRLASALA